MPPNDKLVRWFDLLAALLQRRFPVTFTELARDVPAYAHTDKPSPTLLRMFERDKDELRRAGIRIDTVESTEGEPSSYQLKSEHFYLPYLVLAGAETPDMPTSSPAAPAPTSPAQAARLIPRTGVGARRLPTLSVLPEEAVMLRRAAARVRALGEPQLTTDANQALRKLRHDLPDTILVPDTPDAAHARSDFATLADAVHRRKQLTFEYHSMGRGERDERTVEPYGMVYLTGNWYLVARDTETRDTAAGDAAANDAGASDAAKPDTHTPRQFRTSRMSQVKVNAAQPNSPDFDTPPHFDLRAHARSRQAWELGTGDTEQIDVRFTAHTGDVTTAMQHAEQVLHDAATTELPQSAPPHSPLHSSLPSSLRYRVRRRDTFLRWLLSFGGDAEPFAPPAVVADWRALLTATRDAHAEPV